jgi:hypothetical protein
MPAPSSEAEESQREALRALHQVRPLTTEEEGTGVDRLPRGVWGYTHSPAVENAPLFSRKLFYNFEVHKASDGEVYLIGFLRPDIAAVVETNPQALDLRLFPVPQDDAVTPVSILVSRLVRHKEQSFRDAQGLELQLLPARSRLQ